MNAVRNFALDDDYKRTLAALERFRSLRENWDGEGALRVAKEAIDRALTVVTALRGAWFVPAPQVGAMPDGGVELAWRLATKRGVLEIDVRLVEDGEDELAIGYAHEPGFQFHDVVRGLDEIAARVRESFATKDA